VAADKHSASVLIKTEPAGHTFVASVPKSTVVDAMQAVGMLVGSFDGMLVGSDDGMLLGALVGKIIVAFFARSAEQHSEDLYDASTFPQVTAVPLKVAALPVSWEQHELFW
jgi:hypothetical protein